MKEGTLLSSPLGVEHTLSGDERSANPTSVRVQREGPILFSGPMVRAILDGQKTQTRRSMSPAPMFDLNRDGQGGPFWLWIKGRERRAWREGSDQSLIVPGCPYGQPGDRLWVKETHRPFVITGRRKGIIYAAGGDRYCDCEGWSKMFEKATGKWRPSIFMPRWASRITLELTAVRVERLNDISEADAKAEGAPEPTGRHGHYPAPWATAIPGPLDYRDSYRVLWESINGRGSWAVNPWVWVISFRRVEP